MYNKNRRDSRINLDISKTSGRSFYDIPSFIRNNMNKSINNKNSIKSNLNLKNKETKRTFNKRIFRGYGSKIRNSSKFSSSELTFSSNSFDSNSFNTSHFIQMPNLNINKNESEKIIDNKEKEKIINQKLNPINHPLNSNIRQNIKNDKSSELYTKKNSLANISFKESINSRK